MDLFGFDRESTNVRRPNLEPIGTVSAANARAMHNGYKEQEELLDENLVDEIESLDFDGGILSVVNGLISIF